MASVVLSGDTSGQVTLSAPAIAGSNVLTLPAVTGTLITQGMTLLGTLSTASGATQTLSGLTLTSYKQLYCVYSAVKASAISNGATLGGSTFSSGAPSAGVLWYYGNVVVDLTTGLLWSLIGFSGSPPISSIGISATSAYVNSTSYSTSSTSIVFGWSSSATFAGGTIYVYGVN